MSFQGWIFSHFIWSHRIAASLGQYSLHPIVTAVCVTPSHLISCCVFSTFFHLISSPLVSSHLISSHLISCFFPFLSPSQLIATVLIFSHVIWACLLSCQLIWTLLFSAILSLSILRSSSQLSSSQLFTALLMSGRLNSSHLISSQISQVFSALLSSCQLLSCLLISSVLFSHLISSSYIFSADLSSSQLTLGSSQNISENLLQNRISAPKPRKVPVYHFEALWKANSKGKRKKPKRKSHRKLIVATLAQPFQCDLQATSFKRPWNYYCTQ